MRQIKILFTSLCLMIALATQAEIIFYKFDDPAKEARFNRLIEELRCPKCQNNNLADSNAPLSVDLKDIIYDQINQGATDDQIVSFLKARYGDFISYKPPLKPSTWIIWYGPFVMLLIGGFVVIRFLRQRTAKRQASEQAQAQNAKSMGIVDQWQNEVGDES